MTSTVERPTVEVERIPMARVYALILAETLRSRRREPIGIAQNGPDSDIVRVAFASIAHMTSWCDFFGAPPPQPRKHPRLPIMFDLVTGKWEGWSVQLSGDDPAEEAPVLDAETAALIDEVTAEPGCACAGSFHADTCPAKPNMAEWLGPIAADPPMLCIRCGEPLQPGQPFHQRTAGRVHVGCKLTAGIGCVDCGGLGGSHQESCAFASRVSAWTCPPCTRPGHFTAPDHTLTEGCRYEPGVFAGPRVNVEAAAQIPVVVLEVTPNPAPAPDFDDTIAALLADIDVPVPYTHVDPDAREYVPVDVPTVDPWLDEPTQQLPHRGNHVVPSGLPLLVNGHEPVRPRDHGPVPIVDVLADDPDLDTDERSGAEMARLNGAMS